ncbi:Uncharacterized conserved protein [Geodermatophilus siccatus]|uniref:Uncharacterized conserved protein n=1 Tax=Geodermatophilus siccatus TaxID=1137991 RepID=A0A1G9SET7_9ACTN|nr:YciI family protein [Geodermatophilus siccatus]SDM33912.1 Uncharacterized conserved protein [Geodermatophilus siccatus]
MPQYLLSLIQPDGPMPAPEVLDPIMRDVAAVTERMRAAGAWVFSAGLHPAETATVVRPAGEDVLVTDGPYVEAKEHVGGFTIVEAEDLDAALAWGREVARATTLPVEVRPIANGGV